MALDNIFIKLKNVSLEIPIIDSARLFSKKKLKTFSNSLVGSKKTISNNTVKSKILDNVSFELKTGDSVALLGHNGSGKTTLLRLLSKIYTPTNGELNISGKISPMLSIGSMTNPDLSGYDNIKVLWILMGKNVDLDHLIQKVEDFTELDEFLNLPIKVYSAGMKARLLFAVSTFIKSDILLADEDLSAGDHFFQEKARKTLKEYYGDIPIKIFATHRLSLAKESCNKVFLMKKGELQIFDNVQDGIDVYTNKSYMSVI